MNFNNSLNAECLFSQWVFQPRKINKTWFWDLIQSCLCHFLLQVSAWDRNCSSKGKEYFSREFISQVAWLKEGGEMHGCANLAHLKYCCSQLFCKSISNTLKLLPLVKFLLKRRVYGESIIHFSQIGVEQGTLTQGNGFVLRNNYSHCVYCF